MAIGEFGGAASLSDGSGALLSTPMYWFYELGHAALNPARAFADATRLFFKNPANPLSHTAYGKSVAASMELFERSTRRYRKPEWGIDSTTVGGEKVSVNIKSIWERPFCRLLHFERAFVRAPRRPQPKLLIVAPMSGHYPTLLRGTVETFLPNHDVYITEWVDARMVPLSEGRFDLDDYIDYVISILHLLGGDAHVIAVCQPSVPVLAAVALMEANGDPNVPHSMVLMGGPIDPAANPTEVNRFAEAHSLSWFENTVITTVPAPYLGACRRVYPGFLQLAGFLGMNFDRHVSAHWRMFQQLVEGDDDSAAATRAFYDEYSTVMDLPAEFYLETLERVFQRHDLAHGTFRVHGELVDPGAIEETALMTVEGERDDICGPGQTAAAQRLCRNLPESKKLHHLQPRVGHYGVFNGRRWQTETYPKVREFIRAHS